MPLGRPLPASVDLSGLFAVGIEFISWIYIRGDQGAMFKLFTNSFTVQGQPKGPHLPLNYPLGGPPYIYNWVNNLSNWSKTRFLGTPPLFSHCTLLPPGQFTHLQRLRYIGLYINTAAITEQNSCTVFVLNFQLNALSFVIIRLPLNSALNKMPYPKQDEWLMCSNNVEIRWNWLLNLVPPCFNHFQPLKTNWTSKLLFCNIST